MKITGERYMPGEHNDEKLSLEHMHRYLSIANLFEGKTVLDAACGVGYGTKIISQSAKMVVGIDISKEAIDFARQNFSSENILFDQMSINHLKFPENTFDAVVSFETLEHVDAQCQVIFLQQIKRVLKEEGVLIISTPNLDICMQKSNGKYYNPFHIKEHNEKSFKKLLYKEFKFVELYMQDVMDCSVLAKGNSGRIINKSLEKFCGEYMIAFCSNNQWKDDLIFLDSIYVPNYNRYFSSKFGIRTCLYIDTGNGFNELQKVEKTFIPSPDGNLEMIFNLGGFKGIKSLRIDPCPCFCSFKITGVLSNIGGIIYQPINRSFQKDNIDYFFHDDPGYVFSSTEMGNISFLNLYGELRDISQREITDYISHELVAHQLEISQAQETAAQRVTSLSKLYEASLIKISDLERQIEELNQIIMVKEDDMAAKNLLIENLDNELLNEKNENFYIKQINSQLNEKINKDKLNQINKNKQFQNLVQEKISILNSYQTVVNSTSWKITKPIRYLLDHFKKLINNGKISAKLYKGLVYLKNNGLRSALIKIKLSRKMQSNLNVTLPHAYNRLFDFDFTEDESQIQAYDISVSVIIPTYNAGENLRILIANLKRQKKIKLIEVIIVDSESTDGSQKVCKSMDVQLIEIKQSEFSHSYSRNLGAEKAKGDYLLFMTQDALPTHDFWIYNLATPIIKNDVVAVSCTEFPRSDCDLSYRVDSNLHNSYLGLSDGDRIGELPLNENFDNLRKNAQLSDVACLIKKSVFDKYKYSGDYAEDLRLGIQLLKANFKIALLSSENVIHSHTRPCSYHLKRSLVDELTLSEILPDYPTETVSMKIVVSSILDAAEFIDAVCIFINNSENQSILNFIEELKTNIGLFRNYKVCNDSTIRSSVNFGDNFKDVLLKIYPLWDQRTHDHRIIDDVMYYYETFLIPYLLKNIELLDFEIKKSIADVFVKKFAVACGSKFAHYFQHNSKKNDQLIVIIDRLRSGI